MSNVARAVAWRSIHNFLTNPAFLVPALMFPLFFFVSFAGGLAAIGDVPGFDFPSGYTAFQFVFVLLQSAAFGGVFTGFGIARDFETGFGRRYLLAATDRRGIVAEGTPAELKAEIGRPTVEVIPSEEGDRERTASVLARFGERANCSPRAVAVLLQGGESQLADVVRALDAENIAIEHLQLHAPSLDDVFLAKTGRSLEGAGGEPVERERGKMGAAA